MAHEFELASLSVCKSARCRARYHDVRTTRKGRAGIKLVTFFFKSHVSFLPVAPTPHHRFYLKSALLLVVLIQDLQDLILYLIDFDRSTNSSK